MSEQRTCKRCGEVKPLDDYYLHRQRRADGTVYYEIHATICKRCHCARQRELANGAPRTRHRQPVRVRDDGAVWCPGCQAYLPADRFPRSQTSRTGYAPRCWPCDRAQGKRHKAAEFASDERWQRKLAYERAHYRRHKQREYAERREFVRKGLTTLRSKGLSYTAMATLLRIGENSLVKWRTTDRIPGPAAMARIALALRVTIDLPAVIHHDRNFETDPALLAMLERRMAPELATLPPMRSKWRNREAA